jgi:peptide/nickel transport system substrate-binding protein
LLLGTACGGTSTRSSSTTAPLEQGGSITTVGNTDPTTLNPKSVKSLNGTLMAAVWRGVWRANPDYQFELNTDLVTSAELTSTDPETIIYRINPKATWSDGVPVDADDFIYNWQVARAGATDIDGSPIQGVNDSLADTIASVTGSDGGKTVTIVFNQHYLEWQLSRVFNVLVPAHIARRVGFNTGFDHFDPALEVSDAPFRLGSYTSASSMTLVRNEHYWGSPAHLDRVVIRFTSPDAAAVALRSGEGDMANGQDALPDEEAQFKNIPGITTRVFPSFAQSTVLFNQRNPLLAMLDVRKAMALALDRRAIYERTLAPSTADVVNSFLWANAQPEYHDTSGGLYDRPDPAGAKRLLEAAGFTLGADGVYANATTRLSFRLLTVSAPPYDQSAELVQSQLRAAGIDLRIDAVQPSAFSQAVTKGDYQVAFGTWVKNVFGTINLAPGSSAAVTLGYSNAALDQLMQQARGELDKGKRLDLIDQADRLLWADLPMVPLFQRPLLFAVRSTYVNIAPNVAVGAYWNVEEWARKAAR